MAIDNTPPRLKLIVTIAAITVVTLVSIDFALKSYYNVMTETAQREKMAPPKDLAAQKAAEEAAFKAGATPIEQAMGQIAKGTRAEIVAPKQSDDLSPLTGWSKLPKPAPAVPHPGGALAAPPDHATPGGSGAHAAGDAGAAPRAATADAGVVGKPAPPHAPPHHARDGGAR